MAKRTKKAKAGGETSADEPAEILPYESLQQIDGWHGGIEVRCCGIGCRAARGWNDAGRRGWVKDPNRPMYRNYFCADCRARRAPGPNA